MLVTAHLLAHGDTSLFVTLYKLELIVMSAKPVFKNSFSC